MTSPIQILTPGERPTEPGWYVIDTDDTRLLAEISVSQGHAWFEPSRLRVLDSDRFIARIYPERIEGREG